jgi:hypothetical protein
MKQFFNLQTEAMLVTAKNYCASFRILNPQLSHNMACKIPSVREYPFDRR